MTKPEPGQLHLIPVSLGHDDPHYWLPPHTQQQAQALTVYIAEKAKTARRFLKQINTPHEIRDITIHELHRSTPAQDIHAWLQALSRGQSIGLVSEAGCPAVADPGANVVRLAHDLGYRVIPHVGPSSILLGLMASGLNGQQFVFHGYAPKQAAARTQQLKQWERLSRQHQQTQILIETPYRNQAMLQSLLQTLDDTTLLCVARSLNTPDEYVSSQTVQRWKTQPTAVTLDKLPTLFLYLAQ